MCESPLRGHICNSLPVISPLLIKIGELKSLGTGFLSELNVLNVNWPVVKLSLWHFTVLQAALHIAGAYGLGQVVKARVERSIAADSGGGLSKDLDNGRAKEGPKAHKIICFWDHFVVVTTNTAGDLPRKLFSFVCRKFQVHRNKIQWCLAYKRWNADVNGSPLFVCLVTWNISWGVCEHPSAIWRTERQM